MSNYKHFKHYYNPYTGNDIEWMRALHFVVPPPVRLSSAQTIIIFSIVVLLRFG